MNISIRRTIALVLVLLATGAFSFVLASRLQKQRMNDMPMPKFEVASIKASKSRIPLGGRLFSGDRFEATGSAMNAILTAYGHNGLPLRRDQVSGGASWISSEMFDIEAKVDDSLIAGPWKKLSSGQQRDQVMLMLQSLLADRFKLIVRRETKELPAYALVVAKNGPKFAEDNSRTEGGGMYISGPGKLEAHSSPLNTLPFILSRMPELVGREVVDKTALHGHYSFSLQWTPDFTAGRSGQSGDNLPSSEASGPSLFTALQEQLGLRLESTKAPVDILIIEHIERPTEN